MDILLFGGTGNISTDSAALLHARGHRLTVLTRGRNPIPECYTPLIADHRDPQSMRAALAGRHFDAVVDFNGYDVPDVALAFEVLQGRTGHYIFISTTVVYAKPHARLPVTETAPLGNAFSDYGRKKLACEDYLRTCCDSKGFPVTIVRPSHTYSRRWIPNPVTSVGYTLAARLEQGRPVFVHDDGQGLWTLTATEDFAVGLAGLVGQEASIGEAYHITSDQVLTWNEIMAETCRALGVDHPDITHVPTDFISDIAPTMRDKLMGDKAHNAVFDCAKIKKAVPDFECRKGFRQGIREAIAWFRDDPSRQTINPEVDALFDKVISAWRR